LSSWEGGPQPQTLASKKRFVPPRPEYISLGLASLIGLIVFLAARDIAYTLISWILVFLFVFPFSIIAREIVVLSGTRKVADNSALNVFDWTSRVARILGSNIRITLLYTYRERNGLQVVGLGDTPSREEQASIAFTIHKAAWLARPLPVKLRERVFVVVPGLVFEKLSSIIVSRGSRPVALIKSKQDAKLVYHLLKALIPEFSSKAFTAYAALKLFRRLILEGLIWIDPAIIDCVEKSLPFENIFIRGKVYSQLADEKKTIFPS